MIKKISPDLMAEYKQRQQVLNPAQSFIVQAPAGSGKTGLLIQRYLTLLSCVDEPEEILAITFTKKAAAQMQERILQALIDASNQTPTICEYEQQILQLAKTALFHHAKRGISLIEFPERLSIKTIDAFCLQLVRQMPVLSKLGGVPANIIETADELYIEAARRTLLLVGESDPKYRSIRTASQRVLQAHDMNTVILEGLVHNMLAKREQWLDLVVNFVQMKSIFTNSLRQIIYDTLKTIDDMLPAKLQTELCEILAIIAGHIDQNQQLAKWKHIHEFPKLDINNIDNSFLLWDSILQLCLTDDGKWRRRVNKNQGFPAGEPHNKQRFFDLIGQLQNIPGLRCRLYRIQKLPRNGLAELDRQRVFDLCTILRWAVAELNVIFAEQQKIDFNGISLSAINALALDNAPTDLALHLEHQIRHILVDEYQDISIIQEKLIRSLLEGWQDMDGHSLFLVGDPMQSIYRFREAQVSLFIKTFQSQCIGQVRLSAICLTNNMRCSKAIISWINQYLPDVFSPNDEPLYGAVRYIPFTPCRTELGSVCCYPVFNDEREEARQVVQIIHKIRKKDKQGKIALLVRDRSHLHRIISELKAAQLNYLALDIEPLAQQGYIRDLFSLVCAWLHLADRISWFSVLRAPWCGCSLETLYTLTEPKRTIWESLLQAYQSNQLSDQPRLKYFIRIFSETRQRYQHYSLTQTIRTLWCRLGGPATVNEGYDLNNVEVFFQRLNVLEQGGDILNLQQLDNLLTGLYAGSDPSASDDLQIMTIHKAKGLEFEHVVVAGLHRKRKVKSSELLRWTVWSTNSNLTEKMHYMMAPIQATGNKKNELYQYLGQLEKEQEENEHHRLLYVALTRAKQSLHLIGLINTELKKDNQKTVKSPPKGTLLAALWPAFVRLIEPSNVPVKTPSIVKPSSPPVLKRLVSHWSLPPYNEVSVVQPLTHAAQIDTNTLEYQWAGENIRCIGMVTHAFLQQIGEQGLSVWNIEHVHHCRPMYAAALAKFGMSVADRSHAIYQVEQALLQTITDKRGQWIFDPKHHHAHSEYSVSGLYKNTLIHGVIDRTFIDDKGVCWIIDYKLGRHGGGNIQAFLTRERLRYQEQLQRYAVLLTGLGHHKIELGLYFPLLQAFINWPAKI